MPTCAQVGFKASGLLPNTRDSNSLRIASSLFSLPARKTSKHINVTVRSLAMCGIFCSVSRHGFSPPSPNLRESLEARGPDASNLIEEVIRSSRDASISAWLTFHSTVLSLRSESVVTQPYASHAGGPVLCWNGEAWAVEHVAVENSDTRVIYSLLGQAVKTCQYTDASSMLEILAVAMAKIAGPFAFIYYDKHNECLYFGRDFLGRRSLLYQVTQDGSILLCSVSDREVTSGWTEVEADGLYCIDLRSVSQPENCLSTDQIYWGSYEVFKQAYVRKEDRNVACSSVGRSTKTGRHQCSPQGRSFRTFR